MLIFHVPVLGDDEHAGRMGVRIARATSAPCLGWVAEEPWDGQPAVQEACRRPRRSLLQSAHAATARQVTLAPAGTEK